MIKDILQDLIKIDTRTSIANETEAAVYLKKVCDQFNIENEIIEPVKGKGSFVAHIPGWDKSKKELLLLSHLDTAEFGDLSRWKFHPLSAAEYKGRIVGRGAIDCKGLVSLWLSILINIRKSSPSPPERGIIFAAVADEENGGKYGMEYLIENNELIKNCEYVLGEGGGYPIKLGDTIYYTCQNAEKGSVSYQVETALNRIEDGKETYVRNPLVNLLKGLSTGIYDLELLQFLVKQALSKTHKRRLSLKALTCDSYYVDKNEKGIFLTVKSIPNSKEMNYRSILNKMGLGGHIKITNNFTSTYTAINTKLYNLIVSETSKLSSDYKVIPYTTPGYSDNRFMRSMKKTVYGYFPLSLEDSLSGIHGNNESISIKGLLNAKCLMNNIVSKFTNII